MADKSAFAIAVLAGDGIGPEVMAPCLEILDLAARKTGGFSLELEHLPAGAGAYVETGTALPEETMARARTADAILLGAMGLPDIRYADGTEITPQLDLRFELALYAGVRPIRAIPGLRPVLADPRQAAIDLVILRESTEGLFASHGKGVVTDQEARETLVITRAVSERLFRFAFDLARSRKAEGAPGRVTCVDKANIFKAYAFFRQVFDEIAAEHSDIEANHRYVDATALDLVHRPWELDVLVMENMFGDILSDLGAGLIGGMGFAPSADIGENDAVFQPSHGSAPDIAGKRKANPTAMILSGAMMLAWLGHRHGITAATEAGQRVRHAVDAAFADGGLLPFELGGDAGTEAIADAVLKAL
jgi:3-isopropylmalate dehydrogenase